MIRNKNSDYIIRTPACVQDGRSLPMIDDSGQLSIDFIAGFTIFMLAFIMVMTMTSGLLMSLQSRTVDVDAVAYRTGVILIEDPGECNQWAMSVKVAPDRYTWETIPDFYRTYNVFRMGLSLPKYDHDTPPVVLLAAKTDKFFNSTWDGTYYRNKLIFGDYPYRTNICIQKENEMPKCFGDPLPENAYYGSIRRIGLVKSPTSIDSDLTFWTERNPTDDDRVIVFDLMRLYTNKTPAYQVYPLIENTTVNFIDFPMNITNDTAYTDISDIHVCYPTCDEINTYNPGSADVIINGAHYDPHQLPGLPIPLDRSPNATNILVLKPALFDAIPNIGTFSVVNISISFDPPNSTYLRGVDYYGNYRGRQIVVNNTTYVTNDYYHQPDLTPAWVEVRIW